MTAIINIALLLSVLLSSFFITRLLRPRHRVDFLLIAVIISTTLIVLLGYGTSGLNLLNHPGWWLTLSLLPLAALWVLMAVKPDVRRVCLAPIGNLQDVRRRIRAAKMPLFEKVLLGLLAGTLLVTTIVNLVVLVKLPPATLDGLHYHLARVAYYLQHGNLHAYGANYWAQVVHPKISAVLMIFTFLVAGRNTHDTQFVQFFAYFAGMVAVYGITRHLGARRRSSLFVAFIFGLLIINLMEAVTTQNDLVVTLFSGCTLYFLLAYRATPRVKYLLLAALALALGLGVKSTMLSVLPSMLVVAFFLFRRKKGEPIRLPAAHLKLAAAGLLLALLTITSPAGYGENIRLFHNPLGPQWVVGSHTALRAPLPVLMQVGAVNVLRYGMDFLTLDGVVDVKTFDGVQNAVRFLPRHLFESLGIHLMVGIGQREDFLYNRSRTASENNSFWGVLGFTLIWPLVLWAAFRRSSPPLVRAFAAAALLYFIVQAYASPYDVWRGRYSTTGALFALPPLAFYAFPVRAALGRSYLALVLLLGCLSALAAVTYRVGTFILPLDFKDVPLPTGGTTVLHMPSNFQPIDDPSLTKSELEYLEYARQMAREDPVMPIEGIVAFEMTVPQDAVVALDTGSEIIDGYFFGEHLSRTLLPIRPFFGEAPAVPSTAEYLLFDTTSTTNRPQPGDQPLYNWHQDNHSGALYLRKL